MTTITLRVLIKIIVTPLNAALMQKYPNFQYVLKRYHLSKEGTMKIIDKVIQHIKQKF